MSGSITDLTMPAVIPQNKQSITYVECVQKCYKFVCNKCGKRFRSKFYQLFYMSLEVITSDLSNSAAIDNLEDTLHQP